jgi:hypothetical protein
MTQNLVKVPLDVVLYAFLGCEFFCLLAQFLYHYKNSQAVQVYLSAHSIARFCRIPPESQRGWGRYAYLAGIVLTLSVAHFSLFVRESYRLGLSGKGKIDSLPSPTDSAVADFLSAALTLLCVGVLVCRQLDPILRCL